MTPISFREWPPLFGVYRLTLALGIGLFVGLEREWRRKEAGLRTFGFTALLGGMGGLLGDTYGLACLMLLGLLVFFLNWQSLAEKKGVELTTSAALLVTGLAGVMCGKGHTLTPAAVGVITAGLLAWKERLARFSSRLTAEELRAEILLGILTFAIYPVLPTRAVDPWELIVPQTAFVTVIVIAGIGFVNYVLMKIFGPKGMEITAFFGGLVNSRKVIVELTSRLRSGGAGLLPSVYRGVVLATASMVLRNGLIIVIFAPTAALFCGLPFALMLSTSLALWYFSRRAPAPPEAPEPMKLDSPFRLTAAVQFALVFLALNVAGILAQRNFGEKSFYYVSVLGGFLSSASSIASAATLITHGDISVPTGVYGVLLSSLTSILVNIPLIRTMSSEARFRRKAFGALALVALAGLVGAALDALWLI